MSEFKLGADHLAALLTHIDELIIAYDDSGTVTFVSPAVRDILGYESTDMVGTSVWTHLHPDDLARLADNLPRWIGRSSATLDDNIRVRAASGDWVELAMESVNGSLVEPFGAGIATLRQVRSSTEMEQELRFRRLNEERLARLARTFVNLDHDAFDTGVHAALEEMGSLEGVDRVAVWRSAPDGLISHTHEWVSPTVEPLMGRLEAVDPATVAILNRLANLEEVFIPDTAELGGPDNPDRLALEALGVRCWLAVPMAEAGRFAGFVAFTSQRPGEITRTAHLSTLRVVVGILAEAFARHQAEVGLAYQATHDSLTGLANRWVFNDEVAAATAELGAGEAGVAALLFDLDRFKVVNDSLGHSVGDDLLLAVAGRMRSAALPDELVARLGGDELVVLMRSVVDPETPRRRAEELLTLFERPFAVGQRDILTTASCGVAVTFLQSADPGELLTGADTAMYAAKEAGRNRVVLFDEVLHARVERRHRYEHDLHRALTRNDFALHYQPEFDVASGVAVGVEALLRWNHPDDGLLAASEFVPIAEESGAIVAIGRWVLDEALRQLAAWQHNGSRPATVMRINLSARQLVEPDLVAHISRSLERSEADASAVCFEITETALMVDPARVLVTLEELHDLGVTLAIDDFGTGYSSLAYLRSFPVDVLKIDRSFVQGLGQEADDTTIVRTILSMAESLGLGVTAEGVETEEQLHELRRLGCPRAQGYLLARPAPPDEVEHLLWA